MAKATKRTGKATTANDTSFKQGNRFWERRSKHGRDKLFASPKLLWDAACEYFSYIEDNPEYRSEAKTVSNGPGEGSSIELAKIPVKQPFTLIGLCLYLGCSSGYFRTFKVTTAKEKPDFLAILEEIEETIYNQKFAGAASGFFNANIIARDLGLKEQTVTEQTLITAPELTDEQRKKFRADYDNRY